MSSRSVFCCAMLQDASRDRTAVTSDAAAVPYVYLFGRAVALVTAQDHFDDQFRCITKWCVVDLSNPSLRAPPSRGLG